MAVEFLEQVPDLDAIFVPISGKLLVELFRLVVKDYEVMGS